MKTIRFCVSIFFAIVALAILGASFILFYFNRTAISINYLASPTPFQTDIPTVMLIAFITGAICTFAFLLLGELTMMLKISGQNADINRLKEQLSDLQKKHQ